MNLLLLILEITAIWLAFNAFILLAAYVGIYIIEPRYPEWWECHIVAPDPEEAVFIYAIYSPSTTNELLSINDTIDAQLIRSL